MDPSLSLLKIYRKFTVFFFRIQSKSFTLKFHRCLSNSNRQSQANWLDRDCSVSGIFCSRMTWALWAHEHRDLGLFFAWTLHWTAGLFWTAAHRSLFLVLWCSCGSRKCENHSKLYWLRSVALSSNAQKQFIYFELVFGNKNVTAQITNDRLFGVVFTLLRMVV